MKTRYLVVIEKGDTNFSAFSPDVPGCIATGKTIDDTLSSMRSALEFHIESMVEHGERLPMPMTLDYYVQNTDEVTTEDILAHILIDTPEMAVA